MDFKQAGLEVIHAAKKEGLNHVDALIERTEELEVQIRFFPFPPVWLRSGR